MSKELNKKEGEKNEQAIQLEKEELEGARDQEKLEREQEETPPPSADQLKELLIKAKKAEEYYERLLRQVAETDNLRKRLAKEKQDAIRYANESLIEQLLPIMDSFDMATAAFNTNCENTIESLKTGVEMVHGQLKRTLEDTGLTEINAAGEVFNPALHEAISRKETNESNDGTVIEQIRKGYQLNERLIRPASVIVATSPNSETEEKESELE